MERLKKIIGLMLTILMGFSLISPQFVSAETNSNMETPQDYIDNGNITSAEESKINRVEESIELSARGNFDNDIKPMNTYRGEAWAITGRTQVADVFGSWINGPSGWGPGTVTLSQGVSVSNSYSGALKVSKSLVDSTVGFNISTTYTQTASYSVTPPKGEEWTIKYRPRYNKYKVTQRKYIRLDGTNYWTNEYSYVYPQKFSSFNFDHFLSGER